jgi:hypothetical protein
MNINRLMQRERALKAVIGLGIEDFNDLLCMFIKQLDESETRRIQAQKRQRRPGGGAKALLSEPRMKLLFILVHFRVYPTQDLLGVMFDMSQPNAHKWIHRLTPILEATLGHALQLPERQQIGSFAELIQRYPEMAFIIDATERPISRPRDNERQRKVYSGKKKRHTLKNTVITSASDKRVIILGATRDGSIHDKRLADEDRVEFPQNSTLLGDSGYQGYSPDNANVLLPIKKPRKRELTDQEKAYNRNLSSIRVGVEHAIGGVKSYRIAHDVYRNRKVGYEDRSMLVCCGLYNYRLDRRLRRDHGAVALGR